MLVTLVAVLVQLSTGFVVEKAITDSDQNPSVRTETCGMFGQMAIAQWMQANSQYSEGWSIQSYRCVRGAYVPARII